MVCSAPLRWSHDLLSALGVGKTSLLHRYTQNKFDPKNTTSTTGAFFVTKKVYVDGIKVRLQLWDTAGQERFRSMVRSHILSLRTRLIASPRHPCITVVLTRRYYSMISPMLLASTTCEDGWKVRCGNSLWQTCLTESKQS